MSAYLHRILRAALAIAVLGAVSSGCMPGPVAQPTVCVPALPCSGNLLLTAIQGDTFVFIEQGMAGASACVSGGYEYLQAQADGTLSYRYELTPAWGERIVSRGVLRRP